MVDNIRTTGTETILGACFERPTGATLNFVKRRVPSSSGAITTPSSINTWIALFHQPS